MLSPDACQFAAGMYRIAPLSFLHLFSFSAHITPEKGRFGELLSKLPIKFGNKAKSALLPYSCLDIIQLGMTGDEKKDGGNLPSSFSGNSKLQSKTKRRATEKENAETP